MTSKRLFNTDVFILFKFLFGISVLWFDILYFINIINNFKIYYNQPKEDIFYLFYPSFPFNELLISIVMLLYGLVMIKRTELLLKIIVIYSYAVTLFLIFSFLILMVSSFKYAFSYENVGLFFQTTGILSVTIVFSILMKYDWEKEIRNLGFIKVLTITLFVFILKIILIQF